MKIILKLKNIRGAMLATILLSAGAAFAQDCQIRSSSEMLDALLERNPAILASGKQLKAQSELVSAANVLPNPEVEYGFSNSDSPEGDVIANEVAIGFVLELGGKRSARKASALAEKNLKSIELESIRFNEQSDSIIKWFQYKENRSAIDLYGRAIKLFERYLRTISSRSLSPSQKIEKKTVELAIMDIRLLQAKKTASQKDILKHLSLALDNKCTFAATAFTGNLKLPKQIEKQEISSESIEFKKLKTQTQHFEALLSQSRSNSYPDLTVGPTFGVEQSLLGNQISYGVKLSMALPIFNLGRSSRRASINSLDSQKIMEKSGVRDLDVDLQTLIEKYNNLSSVVQNFPSSDELIQEFSYTENQFRRGVISSSLLIESQRKYIEFLDSQTEFKVEALEALLQIYKSTNKSPQDLF